MAEGAFLAFLPVPMPAEGIIPSGSSNMLSVMSPVGLTRMGTTPRAMLSIGAGTASSDT